MKFRRFTWFLMGVLSVAVIAATTSTVITQTKDLKIQNTTDTVALTIQKGSLTSNAVEILSGSTLKFAVPASGVLPIAYGGTAGATAAAARSALGIAEASTNNILPLANGGTAGTNAASARANLGLNEVVTNATAAAFRSGLGLNEIVTNATAVAFRTALGLNEAVTNATVAGFRAELGLNEIVTNATSAAFRTALGLNEAVTNATVAGFRAELGLNEVVTNATVGAFRTGLGISETATNDIIPVANGGTGSATIAAAKTALGIQVGTVTTSADGTVTNTFATAFSVAPAVVTGLTASNSPTNNITSVTTTNFVVAVGEAAIVVQWIAIGAP